MAISTWLFLSCAPSSPRAVPWDKSQGWLDPVHVGGTVRGVLKALDGSEIRLPDAGGPLVVYFWVPSRNGLQRLFKDTQSLTDMPEHTIKLTVAASPAGATTQETLKRGTSHWMHVVPSPGPSWRDENGHLYDVGLSGLVMHALDGTAGNGNGYPRWMYADHTGVIRYIGRDANAFSP